ncbi:MAG: hypothetical protein NC131_10930 [Roseburia sp.]|nr:hypothetical protein [Roseburia sp.]
MGRSLEEIYNDVIAQATRFASGGRGQEFDDMEELITSEDINKEKRKEETPGQEPGATMSSEIEEVVHFKKYTQRREHKYTESEMKAIRESCEATIVHDYSASDMYHQSDEERRQNDMLADIRIKLGTLKRTYRRPDQYIEAMRVVVQAWEILEKNNYIHTREEFFRLVAKGKITSSSIIMPHFKGIEDYNQDLIIKYISNPDVDASTLRPKEGSDKEDRWYNRYTEDFDSDPEYLRIREEIREKWESEGREYVPFVDESLSDEEKAKVYDDETLDDAALDEMETQKMHRLLDDEELAFVHDHNASNAPKMRVQPLKKKYMKGYDHRPVDVKKRLKKMNKVDRRVAEATHEILNKIQARASREGNINYDRGYIIANGLFSTEKPPKDPWDKLRFQGSWADDTAVFLNDLAAREALLLERSDSEGGFATYADIELNRFFEECEKAGINVLELRRKMNCAQEDIKRANDKRSRKANRKIEAALVRRLSKMNHDPKFKKLIAKAEKEANEQYED